MSIIAYRNRADQATLSVAAGTTVTAGFPLANLKARDSGKFTRFEAFGVAQLIMDFGVPILPRFIGMFGVNRAQSGSGVDLARSSNLSVWTSTLFSPEAIDNSLIGLPPDAKLLIDPLTAAAARYWRISMNWVNGGFRQLARPWVCTASDLIEFPEGIDARWSSDVEDLGFIDRTPTGIVYEDPGAKLRRIKFEYSAEDTVKTFGFASASSAIPLSSSLQDAQLHLGKTGECVVLPRLAPAWRHRLGARGVFVDGLGITDQGGDRFFTTGRHQEELS